MTNFGLYEKDKLLLISIKLKVTINIRGGHFGILGLVFKMTVCVSENSKKSAKNQKDFGSKVSIFKERKYVFLKYLDYYQA